MENNRSTRVNINFTFGYFRAVNGGIVALCISRVPEFIEFLLLVYLLFLNNNVASSLGVNKELYSGGKKCMSSLCRQSSYFLHDKDYNHRNSCLTALTVS